MAQITRKLTPSELEAFDRDGVVLLKNAVSPALVESLREAVDSFKAAPRPEKAMSASRDLNFSPETPGEFWGETFCWRVFGKSPFREAVLHSDLGPLAGQALRSSKVNHVFDQLLVKEPGAATPTLWHHDAPYWPLAGDGRALLAGDWPGARCSIASAWLALDPVTSKTGAMRFVRGSHRWGQRFSPVAFARDAKPYDTPLPKLPDIDALLAQGDPKVQVMSFEYEPGDVSIHHGLLVHSAPPNTSAATRRRAYVTRWAGDGVRWDPRPGIQPFMDPGVPPGAPLDSELFPVVWRGDSIEARL